MPQPILNPPPATDYQQIRDAIEPGLASTVLADSVVGSELYEGRAEADVLAIDPCAYTRTDPQQVLRLRLATILLTASYIRESWQPLRRETVGPYSYDRQRQDPLEAAGILRERAYAQLAALVELTIGDPCPVLDIRPKVMVLGDGGRGDLSKTVDPIGSANGAPLLGWPT